MKKLFILFSVLTLPLLTFASEADIILPNLRNISFFNGYLSGWELLFWGSLIVFLGLFYGMSQFIKIRRYPVHKSMKKVADTIYATCKTYLLQQGRFLFLLFIIVGVIIAFYFGVLNAKSLGAVSLILLWTVLGILGSYIVAWFGIRINTLANCRTSFASLQGKPWKIVSLPLKSGMSVGLLLITIELIMMLFILLFVPSESAGACLIGFAVGESLGASALRIAGGIFTKIADIGSDLMKVIFKIGEDDPRNPGVIADCTGDNAGDSIGPTADGFETYGVTGVALISFIILAIPSAFEIQSLLITWIFVMRILMVLTSIFSYEINQIISSAKYKNSIKFNFEAPLTSLIWITSFISIIVTYLVSYFLLANNSVANAYTPDLWWKLASIISLGTLAAAIIPEFTKIFTSSNSTHVQEIVSASREGGPSLNILSGIVAGNFSAFWQGIVMVGLMLVGFFISTSNLSIFDEYASIFAFGLIAFGFLGMGPVTIAVDSYGPVTDNAQSVFELSQIEQLPGIKSEIEEEFGFVPDFEKGKHYLEANDGAGNTFKATAKPVLIGTAVVGATTMIFAIILLLKELGLLQINLTDAPVILGFITGGAVIYWFSGASIQAVTTGAYRAVEFIKRNLNLSKKEADIEDSKTVVRICTRYAQQGMINIFIVIFTLTLAFAFFDPNFFVAYLISIAIFGLFQAIYMANAGGAWDNAKKVVEVDLREKNTNLHAAAVIGDTVGDPYKDTASVAMNPIIKFSTLFGLLAVEIAVHLKLKAQAFTENSSQALADANQKMSFFDTVDITPYIGVLFLLIGLFFVYRSFYGMRIDHKKE
ncbi:MAG TPA: sodium-translocating pyrophosphatase [Bacteroidales bacterium]|mgnify:CR=1 FL=1|nr:sodium-translocating pyrophosphatase [Bacteroidales bacterium]HRR03968.1 sodium-translocating pyrophosphatase [Bacteroidales bacterium]HRT13445.1 sodium-translocating pyrophosphatase [Bacteroidales bacterium]HXK73723.1 sodium-translocating pyrophosphatase [Bacteroidales bacterium]